MKKPLSIPHLAASSAAAIALALGLLAGCDGSAAEPPPADTAQTPDERPADAVDPDGAVPDAGPDVTPVPALIDAPVVPNVFADLQQPSEGLAFDGLGGLYVSRGAEILRLSPDGASESVGTLPPVPDGAGAGATGMAVGPDGALYVARYDAGRIDRLPLDGGAATVFLDDAGHPNALTFAADGALWFTDSGSGGQADGAVVRVPPQGTPQRVVDGVTYANGIALDEARGFVWFASTSPGSLHRAPLAADGAVGAPELVSDDDALAVADGLALAPDGAVLIAAFAQGAIYAWTSDGLRLVVHDPDQGRLLGVASLALASGPGFAPTSVFATSLLSPTLFQASVLEEP